MAAPNSVTSTEGNLPREEGPVAGLVSVVMPTFNRRPLIARAIASALDQTYRQLELIVIDDGSTDGTEALVVSLGDPRIVYRYQENRGQSSARNLGLRLARGEFIAFLDSDTTWVPSMLERLVGLIARCPEVELAYGYSVRPGARRARSSRPPSLPSGWVTRELLQRNFVCSNSVLLRQRLLERTGLFDESLRSAEDYDLWLRASVAGRFVYDPTLCAYDPVTPGSVSTDLPRNFAANERILRRFFATNPCYNTTWLRRKTWGHFYAGTSKQWSGAGNSRAALKDAIRSLASAPWLAVSYAALLSALAAAVRRR
jgi:glycosyltransferase involved in cell wall biosynthesis